MKTLTGIYKINVRIDSLVEIRKTILNTIEYIVVNKIDISVMNGKVMISETVLTKHADFFRHVKSI